MKVIDLFELLIHDEPMPKNIKYFSTILSWDNDCKDYFGEQYGYFFEYLFASCDGVLEALETEVKIIEEDKKIEKLEKYYDDDLEEYIVETYINGVNYKEIFKSKYDEMMINKINEIIVVLNEMREDK